MSRSDGLNLIRVTHVCTVACAATYMLFENYNTDKKCEEEAEMQQKSCFGNSCSAAAL